MSIGQAIRLHLVSASFVDDADGFVAAFGSLTEWNHVDRAGNDLAGVAPIAEGTDRLSAGPKAPTGFQPGRRHRPAFSRAEGIDRLSAGSKAPTGSQPDRADPWCCLASSSVCCP